MRARFSSNAGDAEPDLRGLHRDAAVEVALGERLDQRDVRVGVGIGVGPVVVVLAEEVQNGADPLPVQLLDVGEGRLRRLPGDEVVRDGWYHVPLSDSVPHQSEPDQIIRRDPSGYDPQTARIGVDVGVAAAIPTMVEEGYRHKVGENRYQ